MSRIGKLPIPIPEKAKVSIDGQTVSVEGPKGSLTKSFDKSVKIELNDNVVQVTPVSDSRHARAMFGTVRSIINGMVIGVVEGYTKKLEIKGVGFRAVLKGNVLDLALGYSHPCELKFPKVLK